LAAERRHRTRLAAPSSFLGSHVERSDWTLRGHLRRITRLSNGFSRKRGEPAGRLGPVLRLLQLLSDAQDHPLTPAMGTGIARKVWIVADLLREVQAPSADDPAAATTRL
jgi:hypothetical protein